MNATVILHEIDIDQLEAGGYMRFTPLGGEEICIDRLHFPQYDLTAFNTVVPVSVDGIDFITAHFLDDPATAVGKTIEAISISKIGGTEARTHVLFSDRTAVSL